MDTPTLLASAGVSISTITIMFLAYRVLKSIIGHRYVSDCCGRFFEIGVDVRNFPSSPSTRSPSNDQLVNLIDDFP